MHNAITTQHSARRRSVSSSQFTRGLVVALAFIAAAASCSPDQLTAPVADASYLALNPDSGFAPRQVPPGPPKAPPTLASLVAKQIGFATYDGSGQVVHPDVVSFAEKWNGYRFWNVITPYPNSATRFENPSLFASNDGNTWAIPAGVKNPLVTTGRGYLSDPDMLYVPERDELRLYYREVQNMVRPRKEDLHVADHVWMTTSKDALKWTAPVRVTSDAGKFVVSPSVLRASSADWRMYEVDAGRDGCSSRASQIVMRRSADGITWNTPTAVSFVQPGYVAWHLDVQYLGAQMGYWAMVAAYPAARGCTATSLFLATSTDGVVWKTYAAPILAPGEVPQFSAAVYRSTFQYAPNDSVTIWYSGARVVRPGGKKRKTVFAWTAAVTHTTVDKLFAHVADKATSPSLNVFVNQNSPPVIGTIVP